MKRVHVVTGILAFARAVLSGSFQQVHSFNYNPTNLQMFVYLPNNLPPSPSVLVALHPCGSSAQSWFQNNKLPSMADSHGIILIYPQTKAYSNCWDVNNDASLQHNGGGDAGGIVAMVRYVQQQYVASTDSVFAMGASSGAMMSGVLAGSYPDVFAGVAIFTGVPFGCFSGMSGAPTPNNNNQSCAQGLSHTPEYWASLVRNAYKGYNDRRPSVLVVHGLADTLVKPQCGQEQLKQWSAVLGLQKTAELDRPTDQGDVFNMHMYGDGTKLRGYFGQGIGHWAPVNEVEMLKFFGLIR